MNRIKSDLNKKLLQQDFNSSDIENVYLKKCQQMAENFVELENGIAVLSDLKNNKSYIYSGKLADELHIFQCKNKQEIESIWEEELFNKLNPDDVLQKHILELRFFQFIKDIPYENRKDFAVISSLRILEKRNPASILHKMFYFSDIEYQNIELALCLYHFDFSDHEFSKGMIINTASGIVIEQKASENSAFLSAREKEILKMVRDGKRSKEIAALLFISINTVNRHRQNIVEKMRVGTTMEACNMATKLKWI
ncbi:MAG: helix-turn-helix transcriptional regulator [Flavobacterium sp.]